MPFAKIKKGPDKGLYRSPSGRNFTKRQVVRYYARGQTFDTRTPAEFWCDAVKQSSDPTGTIDIRKRFNALLGTRWRAVRLALQKQVVELDVLGLKPDTVSPLAAAAAIGNKELGFQTWFDNLLKRVLVDDGSWMRPLMQAAYNRAIKRAMRLTQTKVVPQDQTETVNALSVLCYTELQGVAEAVSQRVMRAATQAWLHNELPRDAFRAMDAALSTVGITRSSAMAELMVVKSFNTATLDQFAAVGVERVGLIAESKPGQFKKDAKTGPGSRISREEVPSARTIARIRAMHSQLEEDLPEEVDVVTAGDDLVCQECEDIEAEGPYSIDEARSLIPAHPRCRCAFAPVDEGILSAVFGTVKGWFNKLFNS